MAKSPNERMSKSRIVRFGGREVITDHPDIRFGHRYAEILGLAEDGRLRVDYGRFHETLQE
jgi:hypothetical protein